MLKNKILNRKPYPDFLIVFQWSKTGQEKDVSSTFIFFKKNKITDTFFFFQLDIKNQEKASHVSLIFLKWARRQPFLTLIFLIQI